MFKPLITLLAFITVAANTLYVPACADTNAEPIKLSFAQSSSEIAIEKYKPVLEQETLSVIEQKHVIPGTVIYAHSFGGDEANRLAKDGVLIGYKSADHYIDLQSGNVLLAPEKDIVVDTHKAKISIAAGATVFIIVAANDVVVYDLLQTKPKQVSINVDKHKLVMEPGQLLAVTEQSGVNNFENLDANSHCVTYRNAIPCALNSKTVKAFKAEFSLASAMTTIQPLQRLTVSNHKEDKLVLEKLIKVAVLLGDFATTTDAAPQVAANDNRQIAEVGKKTKALL